MFWLSPVLIKCLYFFWGCVYFNVLFSQGLWLWQFFIGLEYVPSLYFVEMHKPLENMHAILLASVIVLVLMLVLRGAEFPLHRLPTDWFAHAYTIGTLNLCILRKNLKLWFFHQNSLLKVFDSVYLGLQPKHSFMDSEWICE